MPKDTTPTFTRLLETYLQGRLPHELSQVLDRAMAEAHSAAAHNADESTTMTLTLKLTLDVDNTGRVTAEHDISLKGPVWDKETDRLFHSTKGGFERPGSETTEESEARARDTSARLS